MVIGLESINLQSGAEVLRGLPLAKDSQNLVDSQECDFKVVSHSTSQVLIVLWERASFQLAY